MKVPDGRLGIKITELEKTHERHNSNDTRTVYPDTRQSDRSGEDAFLRKRNSAKFTTETAKEKRHVIVNGVLMVKQGKRGRR